MAPRRSSAPLKAAPPSPVFYTAQDVARFCEVDLKTIHLWADRGKIVHQRTTGRHLRFRRNDVLRFLRGLGYPLPPELRDVRPRVAFARRARSESQDATTLAHAIARSDATLDAAMRSDDDALASALAHAFDLHVHDAAALAIAHLVADAPDALLFSIDDATIAGTSTVAALARSPATAFVALAAVGPSSEHAAILAAGAERIFAPGDAEAVVRGLADLLAVDAPAAPAASRSTKAQRPSR